MHQNRTLLLLSIAFLLAALLIVSSARAGQPAHPLLQSGAPPVVSYQGQVKVDNSPYTGTGYFKFAVVNWAGDVIYWSNDGTASGEPTTAITTTVSNGLFNVLLGDTTLANMTALPASAFDSAERYLRVWFSSDGSTFTLFSPDRRIAAVPYALQAEEAMYAATAGDADTVDGWHASDFAGSAHDHDAAYVNEGQADSVTSAMVVSGTLELADIGQNDCASDQIMKWNGSAWACANDNQSTVATSSTGATTYLTDSCANYSGGQVTINATGPGTIIVQANAYMLLTHENGFEDTLILGIGTTTTDCGPANDQVNWTIPYAYPSAASTRQTFTVRRAFSVSGAGAYTYYLNGYMGPGYTANTDKFWFAAMDAVYYP